MPDDRKDQPAEGTPRAATGRSDLPAWLTTAVPVLLMGAFVVTVLIDYDAGDWWVAQEASFFEHGTVAVLLPAVLAAFWAGARGRFPRPWVRWWIVGWALACLYFAGEEASWGQHYFGWDTPEAIAERNKQDETNLHNMSSWLNMKPRTLVETWIVVGGLVLPIVRRIRAPERFAAGPDLSRPDDWFWPTSAGIATASINLVGRGFDASHKWFEPESEPFMVLERLGSSEAREFFIASFLSVWLASFALRARRTRAEA
jgi:hypothetical protein